jgi:xanthine dehydrogenase YagR molybdenum-binding subunit
MAVYTWPAKDKATAIGTRVKRLDGPEKSTGKAKYSYDINLKNQLIAKGLGCPHAHCKIKSIDVAPALKVPGVVHAEPLRQSGNEIEWQGELLAVVAAETEGAAREGVAAIKVEYEQLPVFVEENNLEAAQGFSEPPPEPKPNTFISGRAYKGGGATKTVKEPGDNDDEATFGEKEIERLLKESTHVVEASYGIDCITHCCLEPHGSTVEWQGNKLVAHLSTQNVSGTAGQFATPLSITADDVTVHCDYIGGGFGSKFAADYWGVAAARISQKTGRPVKFMLDRDQELKLGGSRPSGYIKVRLGADKDGVVQVWDSTHWGSAGASNPGGVSQAVIPYVFTPPNYRRLATSLKTNHAQARAWRAPNHPQGCAITQTAYDDLAAKMGADSLEIFRKNLPSVSNGKQAIYEAEMDIGAKLIGWKEHWHPHGKGQAKGSVVEGLGLAIHTWGGGANNSSCRVKVHPDGGVEMFCGSQDLGVGTRTVVALVLAECFGLPVEAIKVNIGSSKYPASGPSGGSTTVGGIAAAHRRAGVDAFEHIAGLVGKKLSVDPATLEAVKGRVQVKGDASKSVSWKEACSLLGMTPLEKEGVNRSNERSDLTSSQVGGVQFAHVAVDKETGVIKLKKFVAVQDMGLIIAPVQAESQIYGAVIMGIAYALFEQRISDPKTGAFVNSELKDYKLCRLGDIGEIVVSLYEPESERARGIVGLGEPPVISPGAAISNAVANALGVRVPTLPMTPQRVLAALGKG